MEDKQLILKDAVHATAGAAIEALNGIGRGLIEKPCENALVVEFKLRETPARPQARFPVHYKGARGGEFIPDLIAFDAVVADAKVIDRVTGPRTRSDHPLPADHEEARWRGPEFQEPRTGAGANRLLISVHSWLNPINR